MWRPLRRVLLAAVVLLPVALVVPELVNVAAVVVRGTSVTIERFDNLTPVEASSVQARLTNRPEVVAVGIPGRRHLLEADRTNEQWALRRLEASSVAALSSGEGVTVAVVDTGVDASHPDLSTRVLPGADFVTPASDGRTDPNGHGTHVAGIIAAASDGSGTSGLAANVRILPVRVLNADGYGDDALVAAGVLWAVEQGADVINLSLGGPDRDPLLAQALELATQRGVTVVAAAGNDGLNGDTVSYPGAEPSVLAVAASTVVDTRAAFSTRGSYVDLAAPGLGILSTLPASRYGYLSGTSMATPYVVAAAALVRAHLGVSGQQVVDRLTASATDLGATGRDDEFGWGLVDPYAALTTGAPRQARPPSSTPPTLPDLPTLPPLPVLPSLPAVTLPPVSAPSLPKLTEPTLPSGKESPQDTARTPQEEKIRARSVLSARVTGNANSGFVLVGSLRTAGNAAGAVLSVTVRATGRSSKVLPAVTGRDGSYRVLLGRKRPSGVVVRYLGDVSTRPATASWPKR